MKTTSFHGCYDSNWKGAIVDEAFAHPAKFARGLIERIIDHGLDQGYWKRGDLVGDPFGGVGLGGIVCASRGVRWIGVELELRFQRLGAGYDCPGMTKQEWVRWFGRWDRNERFCPDCQSKALGWYVMNSQRIPSREAHRFAGNFDLHRRMWGAFGDPLPVLVQGDSRHFAEIVAGALDAVVTSPPFADSDQPCASQTRAKKDYHAFTRGDGTKRDHQMTSPGNIAQLKSGDLDAVVTSPPYAEGQGHGGAATPTPHDTKGTAAAMEVGYGSTPGQIGALKSGSLDAVVTSPPYAESLTPGNADTPGHHEHRQDLATAAGHGRLGGGQLRKPMRYSNTTPGQIGALKSGTLDAIVTSPPYAETVRGAHRETETAEESRAKRVTAGGSLGRSERHGGYGVTEGQIGALREGVLDAVVTSPPFADSNTKPTKMGEGKGTRADGDGAGRNKGDYHYPESEGQIGNLKEGVLDACVTSPPFMDELARVSRKGIGSKEYVDGKVHIVERRRVWAELNHEAFSAYLLERRSAAGLSKAEVDRRLGTNTVYSFYEGRRGSADQWRIPLPSTYRRLKDVLALDDRFDGTLLDTETVEVERRAMKMGHTEADYGSTPGQIGKEKQENYWGAMKTVYFQMLVAMKPGAVAAVVLKDFVKQKKRVPLCDQTCQLLESLGLEVFERTRAWLVKETRHPDLFGGEDHVVKTERKSFFRRLAEKKGSPRIDYEEVIWARKPGDPQNVHD